MSKPQGCTCTEIEIPELQGEFGDEGITALDMDPDCPVHDFKEVVSLMDFRTRGESVTSHHREPKGLNDTSGDAADPGAGNGRDPGQDAP